MVLAVLFIWLIWFLTPLDTLLFYAKKQEQVPGGGFPGSSMPGGGFPGGGGVPDDDVVSLEQGGRRHTSERTMSTRNELLNAQRVLVTNFIPSSYLRSFWEDNRHDRRENQCLTRGFWCTIPTTWGKRCKKQFLMKKESRRDLPRDNPLVSVEVLRGKLIQKLLLNQKCMGYSVRAYYSISPTRYYKDDSWWSADLKSNEKQILENFDMTRSAGK
nr:hypothetical protein [Tanacetum cinerariifolium]